MAEEQLSFSVKVVVKVSMSVEIEVPFFSRLVTLRVKYCGAG